MAPPGAVTGGSGSYSTGSTSSSSTAADSAGGGSSGGGSSSGGGGGRTGAGAEARTRGLTLFRRPGLGKLGFSLRGGKEHGTGFFVTAVEPASEAAHQGLAIGDQILRINGFPVEDATHKEVLQLIQAQSTINFKVKSVGMIPVKENPDDELSWQIVEPNLILNNNNNPHHQTDLYKAGDVCDDPSARCVDVKMVLRVPPRAKLGCGICKGPEWKPGVFIQFTKENSIARLAGLRPGDQILQCNNFVFTPETPFNEAVSVMRCSGVLELIVRKGAGLELFPGESSGYNSSASSVAGDNPPRLATLAEESNSSSNGAVNGSDYRPEHEPHRNGRTEYPSGCTVIHVNGDETDNKKIAEICMVSQQLETKTTTVFVEVHHSEEDSVSNTQSEVSTDRLTNSSSVSSFTSSASSLSSAISQEIERRSKRTPANSTPVKNPPKQTDKLIKNGLAKEKVEQHEQLMMEFKKAHRKMFSSDAEAKMNEEREEKRLSEEKRNGTVPHGSQGTGKDPNERLKSKRQATPPPPPPLPVEEEVERTKPHQKCPGPPPPPPSPPTPPTPPPPPYCPTPDYDTLSLASVQEGGGVCGAGGFGGGKGGRLGDIVEMQSLESFKLTSPSTVRPKPPNTYFPRGQESYNGFSSTASTVALRDRSPSKPLVTIREYPGGKERKNPTKFNFLHHHQSSAPPPSATAPSSDEPIASRLQSELSQALSRAAVLSKADECSQESQSHNHHNGNQPKGTVVTINVSSQNKTDPAKPFFLFPNGNHHQLLNGVDNKKLSGLITSAASKNSLVNGNVKPHSVEIPAKNSVTFNFSHNKGHEVRNGHTQKNGILKNGNTHNNNNNISQVQIQSQMTVGAQKSIKFG